MKCVFCKVGETKPGNVTVTLSRKAEVVGRDELLVVFRNVPADVCDNCGEYYLSESVTYTVLKRGEEAARNNAEIEVLQFAA
ncbi:MAG: type II toxin-antitoxin system MqsA family antitoxin [Candidatus Kryptoniota bacterium]